MISPPTHQVVFSSSGVPLWPTDQVGSLQPLLQWPQPTASNNYPAHQVKYVPTLLPQLGAASSAFTPPANQVSSSLPPPQPPVDIAATAAHQVSSTSPALPLLPASSGKMDPRVLKLLLDFPEVCQQPAGPPRPSNGVEHVIETTGMPVLPNPTAWILTSSGWQRRNLPS